MSISLSRSLQASALSQSASIPHFFFGIAAAATATEAAAVEAVALS
jgi:hypothetical protein